MHSCRGKIGMPLAVAGMILACCTAGAQAESFGLPMGDVWSIALSKTAAPGGGEPGACCYEPEPGMIECDVVTELECIEFLKGQWMGANTNCDDLDGNGIADICEDQPDPPGACCFLEPDIGISCVVVLDWECQEYFPNSFWMGPGTTCADFNGNGVADICEDFALGACCFEGPNGIECLETLERECIEGLQGEWKGLGTRCDDFDGNGIADICDPEVLRGACCFDGPNGIECRITSDLECFELYFGDWKGPGTTCDDFDGNGVADVCEGIEVGACCYQEPDGTIGCVTVSIELCDAVYGGIWKGPGTFCIDGDGNGVADICEEEERGACCYDPDLMLCVVTTLQDCQDQYFGMWMGPGTNCSDLNGNGIADICENPDQLGACCYEDSQGIQCIITNAFNCDMLFSGDWKGVGTNCDDLNGNGIADICEEEERGACCYDPDLNLCVVTTEADCLDQYFGDWKGPGTDCTDADGNGIADICEDPTLLGACCYGQVLPPQCIVTNLHNCEQLFNGMWMGPGTNCDDLDGNGVADICEPDERGACCFQEPDGVIQCLVITEAECMDLPFGDWKGPGTTCTDADGNGIADICEDPQLLGACCYENDQGIQCVVTDFYNCDVLFAGIWQGPGTDCTDADGNGIADICEPEERGACCFREPDTLQILCVVTTLDDCEINYAGDWKGPGTDCSDLNGNGVADICEDPQLLGACCYEDAQGIQCVVTDLYNCDVLFAGIWQGPGTDCTDADGNGIADICEPEERGACCFREPDTLQILCVVTTLDDCEINYAGDWKGPGTDCSDLNGNGVADICEPEGACCYLDGDGNIECVVTTAYECEVQYLGDWKGVNTNCDDNNGNGVADVCEPLGACCFEEPPGTIQCLVTTEYDCQLLPASDWKGPGTNCDDLNGNGIADICEPVGACCFEEPPGTILCVVTTAYECEEQYLGDWKGPGTDCSDLDGNGVADICEDDEVACCIEEGNILACVCVTQEECRQLGGFVPIGGVCLGDNNGNGSDDACEMPEDRYVYEFSVDIGSDGELSDPNVTGNEGFDPGDVYIWQGPPVTPPLVPGGRDGFKDDEWLFGFDPFPAAPDMALPPGTAVPVGEGSPDMYFEFFDLDAHDQIDVDPEQIGLIYEPLEFPIPMWDSPCIFWPEYLMVSFDDDQAPGWPAFDVPVTVPPSHGDSIGDDEIWGLILAAMPTLPAPIVHQYEVADERRVHQSLAPNPDGIEEFDDDVDSLDIGELIAGVPGCPFWCFSSDHEATGMSPFGGPLDPGDIYVYVPGVVGIRPIVDAQMHLGLPPGTDVDAFEFVWAELPDFGPVLAIVFSVDEDDPLTNPDESGGRDPRMLYVSYLLGFHEPATDVPLRGDVDAVTAWRDWTPILCPGDMNCDGVVDFDDINPFVLALSGQAAYKAQFPFCPWMNADTNGDGVVNFDDINAFVALLGTTCD